MSSISLSDLELNLNCIKLPFYFKRIMVVYCSFSCRLPVFLINLILQCLKLFHQNTQTSSLSYQRVANLPHLSVSFRDYYAMALQLILLQILLLKWFIFLSQKHFHPGYLALVLGWFLWFSSFYSCFIVSSLSF